jgi:3-oxoadipate enol-lactonase
VPDLVASDGVDIHYEVFGRPDGEPLLMIQGLGTDSRGWAFQRLAFGRRFRCYAIDNRGVGRSGRPPGPYSLFQMADDAVRILDAEGIDAAHVIGASMGGAIAQIIGVLYAERTRSLVLACTACRHHPWRRELLADWAAAVQEKGMAALGDDGLQWLIGPRLRRRFGLWLNLLARILLQSPPEPFVAQVDAILDMSDELRFELSGVTVPTLVITGSQDALTPVGDAEELAELIPHARLVIIPRAAHGLMVETPNAFNAAVLEFFADITGDATVDDDAADQAASA